MIVIKATGLAPDLETDFRTLLAYWRTLITLGLGAQTRLV
jgi:hypothetical protein